jgi:hypothetical protein
MTVMNQRPITANGQARQTEGKSNRMNVNMIGLCHEDHSLLKGVTQKVEVTHQT